MEEKTIIEEALYEFDRYVEDTISSCTDGLPIAPDNAHDYDWTMGFIKGLRVAREYFRLYFQK